MEELSILPVPCGTRILVKMWKESETIGTSGIVRPQSRVADEQNATIKAKVLALGPDAYADANRLPISKPYCAIGDWVILASFAGNRFSVTGDDSDYRIVQDTAVIAVCPDPEKVERFSHA